MCVCVLVRLTVTILLYQVFYSIYRHSIFGSGRAKCTHFSVCIYSNMCARVRASSVQSHCCVFFFVIFSLIFFCFWSRTNALSQNKGRLQNKTPKTIAHTQHMHKAQPFGTERTDFDASHISEYKHIFYEPEHRRLRHRMSLLFTLVSLFVPFSVHVYVKPTNTCAASFQCNSIWIFERFLCLPPFYMYRVTAHQHGCYNMQKISYYFSFKCTAFDCGALGFSNFHITAMDVFRRNRYSIVSHYFESKRRRLETTSVVNWVFQWI